MGAPGHGWRERLGAKCRAGDLVTKSRLAERGNRWAWDEHGLGAQLSVISHDSVLDEGAASEGGFSIQMEHCLYTGGRAMFLNSQRRSCSLSLTLINLTVKKGNWTHQSDPCWLQVHGEPG